MTLEDIKLLHNLNGMVEDVIGWKLVDKLILIKSEIRQKLQRERIIPIDCIRWLKPNNASI